MSLQSPLFLLSSRLSPSQRFARSRIRCLLPQVRHDIRRSQHRQTRSFLSSSILSPSLQRISASRTLPYPALPIYLTIANVPEYSTFLPYCLSSRVTHWSHEDEKLGRRWPERAELEVGWGAVRERFASKIYCVPGRVVEAVAGDGVASVHGEDIAHHSHADVQDRGMSGDVFTHLVTRWEVSSLDANGGDNVRTKVTLNVEVKFANPMYAALTEVASDKVALTMMEAFENKVAEEIRRSSSAKSSTQDFGT